MIHLLLWGTFLFLAVGVLYFGTRKEGYSHIRNTISELGEVNAPDGREVNRKLFLPAGLILIGVGIAGRNQINGWGELAICMGSGYLLSAFFPCDKGAPLIGGLRQMMHNAAGVIEYGGSIYFLYKARPLLFYISPITPDIILLVLIICALLAPLPVIKWRGFLQRIIELIFFTQLLWLSYHSGI